jgi:hypothetical protein
MSIGLYDGTLIRAPRTNKEVSAYVRNSWLSSNKDMYCRPTALFAILAVAGKAIATFGLFVKYHFYKPNLLI